jgi:hypothetical protein
MNQGTKGEFMFKFTASVFASLMIGLLCCASVAPAQVSVGIDIGAAPVCPYGYFDYAPYDCAPYGYYGPDWFDGGVFIGAGPWFHGHSEFYGHVDNRYDPHHGYNGPIPERGAQRFNHFQGNEARDGRGNVGNAGHDAHAEHALPGYHGGGTHGGASHGSGHH